VFVYLPNIEKPLLRAHITPLVTFKSTKLPYVPLALAIKTQKFFPLKKVMFQTVSCENNHLPAEHL
jgi:hypothetical protein